MSLCNLQLPPSCQLQSFYNQSIQKLQAGIHSLSLKNVETQEVCLLGSRQTAVNWPSDATIPVKLHAWILTAAP